MAKNYIRNCPKCECIIFYKSKSAFYTARKQNKLCLQCALKNRKPRVFSEKEKEQARNQLAKVSNSRPLYNIWLEKFGKEIADQKLQSFKEKQSLLNSGTNNNMYGKPSPQGSGNGWSGWYKSWYFRSLRELSFMINVIESQNLSWKIPDKNFRITYVDYKGNNKTYIPDFIMDNKIIEIKPTKLHTTPTVLAKKKAAEKFAANLNMEYELIDPPILSELKIKEIYIINDIKFLPKYEAKFKRKYLI